MKVGDLVWMPPDEHARYEHSGVLPVESELVCGLILSEPQRLHPSGPLRVRVLWTEPEGDVSIDSEPADWLEIISV